MLKIRTTRKNVDNSWNFGIEMHLQCKIQETLAIFILQDLRRLRNMLY